MQLFAPRPVEYHPLQPEETTLLFRRGKSPRLAQTSTLHARARTASSGGVGAAGNREAHATTALGLSEPREPMERLLCVVSRHIWCGARRAYTPANLPHRHRHRHRSTFPRRAARPQGAASAQDLAQGRIRPRQVAAVVPALRLALPVEDEDAVEVPADALDAVDALGVRPERRGRGPVDVNLGHQRAATAAGRQPVPLHERRDLLGAQLLVELVRREQQDLQRVAVPAVPCCQLLVNSARRAS